MNCKIKHGKDLTADELETINKTRQLEFQSSTIFDTNNAQYFYEHIFFLVEENNKIHAFGLFLETNITFLSVTYKIFGIASIVSLQKGKGYGKILMEGMKDFVMKSGKTPSGF